MSTKMDSENKSVSMFSLTARQEQEDAITNLLEGKTPPTEIKHRPMRDGDDANYVSTYYMTRQISLVTGFRWESEPLEERYYPDTENPVEIGVKVKVTIYDNQGKGYSHTSWGSSDVARWGKDQYDKVGNLTRVKGSPISIFDTLKSAESDAIKKCLSYFGIANDVYGKKEIDWLGTGNPEEESKAFRRWLETSRILISEALEVLNIKSLSEIQNYKQAQELLIAFKQNRNKKGGE